MLFFQVSKLAEKLEILEMDTSAKKGSHSSKIVDKPEGDSKSSSNKSVPEVILCELRRQLFVLIRCVTF